MENKSDFSHMRDILEQVIGPYNEFKMSTSDNKWYRDPKFFNDFICGRKSITERKNKQDMYDEKSKNRTRGDRRGEDIKNGFNTSVAAADLLLSDDDCNDVSGGLRQRKSNSSSQSSAVDSRLQATATSSSSMCASDSTKATGMKKWVVRKKERDGQVQPLGSNDTGTPNKTSAEPSVIAAVRSCLSFKVLASPVAPLSDSDTDTMGDFMESDGVDSAHTPLTDKMAFDSIDTKQSETAFLQQHLARKLFGDSTSSDEDEEVEMEESEEMARGGERKKVSSLDTRNRLTYNDDVYEADDMEDILMRSENGDSCRLNATDNSVSVSSRSTNKAQLVQRHGLTQFSILLSLLDKLEKSHQQLPSHISPQIKTDSCTASIPSPEAQLSSTTIAATTKHRTLPKIPKKKRPHSPSPSPGTQRSGKRVHSDSLHGHVSKSKVEVASPSYSLKFDRDIDRFVQVKMEKSSSLERSSPSRFDMDKDLTREEQRGRVKIEMSSNLDSASPVSNSSRFGKDADSTREEQRVRTKVGKSSNLEGASPSPYSSKFDKDADSTREEHRVYTKLDKSSNLDVASPVSNFSSFDKDADSTREEHRIRAKVDNSSKLESASPVSNYSRFDKDADSTREEHRVRTKVDKSSKLEGASPVSNYSRFDKDADLTREEHRIRAKVDKSSKLECASPSPYLRFDADSTREEQRVRVKMDVDSPVSYSSKFDVVVESTREDQRARTKVDKRLDDSFTQSSIERKSFLSSSPSRSATKLNGVMPVVGRPCRLVEKGTQMEPEPPQPQRNKAVNMVRPHTVTTRVASQEFDTSTEHVFGVGGAPAVGGDAVLRLHHEVKREVKTYEDRVLATNPEIFFNEATELKRQLERMQHGDGDGHTYIIIFLNMMHKFLCGCFCQEEQARNRAVDNYIKTKELVHYYSNKIERRFKSKSTSKPPTSGVERVRTQFTLLLCNMIRGFVSMQLFRMQRREINTLRNDINRDRQLSSPASGASNLSSETTSTPSPAAPGTSTGGTTGLEHNSKMQRYFKLMESVHSGLEYWCFVEQLRVEGGSALKSVEELCIRKVGHSTPQLMDPLALFLRYLFTVTSVLADEQLIASSLL